MRSNHRYPSLKLVCKLSLNKLDRQLLPLECKQLLEMLIFFVPNKKYKL